MAQKFGNSGNGNNSTDRIIDFGKVRQEKLEEKRKDTERVFFNNLINVCTLTNNSHPRPIDLIDVSEEGCSFQIPYDQKNIWSESADEIPIRLYFSQNTYLEIHVKIQNSTPCIDKNSRYIRFGCTVAKELSSYNTYQTFVRFLKLYSENAHTERRQSSTSYF